MGLLNLFDKAAPSLLRLPEGSFTVDRAGTIVSGTVPRVFPTEIVHDIANLVLASFRKASAAQLPLSELIIEYPSLKITAHELRGGAIIFMSPRALTAPDPQN